MTGRSERLGTNEKGMLIHVGRPTTAALAASVLIITTAGGATAEPTADDAAEIVEEVTGVAP
jgi:hypothetical protein